MSKANNIPWADIQHKHVTIGNISFDAPVAISYDRGTSMAKPVVVNDEYLYALPGGGRITESGVIL